MEAGSWDGDSAACSLEAASKSRFSSISIDLEDLVSQARFSTDWIDFK